MQVFRFPYKLLSSDSIHLTSLENAMSKNTPLIEAQIKICVFCGAKFGNNPIYQQSAIMLADAISSLGATLVYGGANVGIMNVLANQVLLRGAQVIGVIPQSLANREIAHQALTKLHVVNSMQERKQLLIDISDAFILFPGSVGSLDEFFEVYTLSKLGYLNKPLAILNVDGYYDPLIKQMDCFVQAGFEQQHIRNKLIITDSVDDLLDAISAAVRHEGDFSNSGELIATT